MNTLDNSLCPGEKNTAENENVQWTQKSKEWTDFMQV